MTDEAANRPDQQLPRLVLASASPRRREILDAAGLLFDVMPSGIEERTRPGEAPRELAERLAREKALDVAQRLAAEPARPVLGSDTIVVCDTDVLGKPIDRDHAVELLSQLMGRRHVVMTGVSATWSDGRTARSIVVSSEVEMRAASRSELVEYVACGESDDKAGGYALQGEGRRFVVDVRGSETNVIGLPIHETLDLLEAIGWPARRWAKTP